jgi:hypothetical protein
LPRPAKEIPPAVAVVVAVVAVAGVAAAVRAPRAPTSFQSADRLPPSRRHHVLGRLTWMMMSRMKINPQGLLSL